MGGVVKTLRRSNSLNFQKLEKAVAVYGMWSGVPEETPGKSRENCWKVCARIAKCHKF